VTRRGAVLEHLFTLDRFGRLDNDLAARADDLPLNVEEVRSRDLAYRGRTENVDLDDGPRLESTGLPL